MEGTMARELNKLNRHLFCGVCAIGLLTGYVSQAKAEDDPSIRSEIEALRAEVKELRKQVQDARAQAAAAETTAANAAGSDLDLKVKWKGSPEFSSGDGKKFKFKVRGRVLTDYNGIDQDESITGEGDINAVELRQARLGVEGVVFYDWKYKFEVRSD